MHLISYETVRESVPYSKVHLWRLEKVGKFPKRVKVGAGRVAWVAEEVDAWVKERVAQRDVAVVSKEAANEASAS